MRRHNHHRAGYTLLEMLCVITIILVLGALILPTLRGMFQDSRVKAAADMCLSRVSMARGYAIDQGRAFVFDVSPDGRQIRVIGDDSDPALQAEQTDAKPPAPLQDTLPDEVTLKPLQSQGNNTSNAKAADGWTRLATFLPDGTCRETYAAFELNEPGVTTTTVEIRGLTGSANVMPPANKKGSP